MSASAKALAAAMTLGRGPKSRYFLFEYLNIY